jgi:DNA-binding CsgD family transcriptional regulator
MARRRDSGPLNQLTDREREVLALMAEGHSNQGICDRLFLSPKTVEAHVSQIFLKLDCVTRSDTTAGSWPFLPSCVPPEFG